MIHHIIPKHEWKKRFGNLRGVNSSDNVVNLTAGQHVQAHQLLFELNGCAYDKLASDGLSGIIGKEEIIKRVVSIANKGKKRSLGVIHTVEQRQAQSLRQRGTHRKVETIERMSTAQKGNRNAFGAVRTDRFRMLLSVPHTRVVCPHCGRVGGSHAMKRYHFDNCKGKL